MKILSIDIGTTNIKAIYKDGPLSHNFNIPVKTISNGIKREQDPLAILQSIQQIIDACHRDFGLKHIVLSTAMHTLLFFDESMNPISNVMLWSDNRSQDFVKDHHSSDLNNYSISGTPFHPMSPYTKVLHEKKYFENAAYIGDLKSFLMFNLTGHFVTDISNASASGLMDIFLNDWSLPTLKACNITYSQLPNIKPIDAKFTTNGLTVHIGSSDGVMANRGVHGAINQLVLSVGTSVGVRYLSDTPYLHPHGKSFCYNAGFGQYLIGNASNNGGNHLEWLIENIDKNLSYNSLVKAISSGLPDSIIAPYFYGERGPWWLPHIPLDTKVFETNEDDLILKVVYGVFTNIQLLIQSLPKSNKELPIILTGGFFRNETIAQALCNYINQPLMIVEDEQAVCNYGLEMIESLPLEVSGKVLEPNYSIAIQSLKLKSLNYLKNYIQK